jgi:hypothetical protein
VVRKIPSSYTASYPVSRRLQKLITIGRSSDLLQVKMPSHHVLRASGYDILTFTEITAAGTVAELLHECSSRHSLLILSALLGQIFEPI